MTTSSDLPRTVRGTARAPGRLACLLLAGLAVLAVLSCMLTASPTGAAHHPDALPSSAVALGGVTDALAFTDGAGAHDHGDGYCGSGPELILGAASSFHPLPIGLPAQAPAVVTVVGEGLLPQSSGTARSPASVPHLLCVMRT